METEKVSPEVTKISNWFSNRRLETIRTRRIIAPPVILIPLSGIRMTKMFYPVPGILLGNRNNLIRRRSKTAYMF
ncbi:hypothetical protein ACFL6I_11730 [candidate division KSB1 bacterium]